MHHQHSLTLTRPCELCEKHEVEGEVGEEVTEDKEQQMLAVPTEALISMLDSLHWQNDGVHKMTAVLSSG
jgi:hypothetical protein